MLRELPPAVRRQARKAYRLFVRDAQHPSLQFKPIHPREPIYSVRVSLNYRAVATKEGDDVIWFWIGRHEAYDKLIKAMRRAR